MQENMWTLNKVQHRGKSQKCKRKSKPTTNTKRQFAKKPRVLFPVHTFLENWLKKPRVLFPAHTLSRNWFGETNDQTQNQKKQTKRKKKKKKEKKEKRKANEKEKARENEDEKEKKDEREKKRERKKQTRRTRRRLLHFDPTEGPSGSATSSSLFGGASPSITNWCT